MRTNQAGVNLIKRFETFQPKAYRCPANVLTIGYGHTGDVKEGHVITEHQADIILAYDLEKFEAGVESLTAGCKLSSNEFSALVCFAFNVGTGIGGPPNVPPGGLKGSTLLKKLKAGDKAGAANEFLRWNKAAGKVLRGLTLRREAERALFLTA